MSVKPFRFRSATPFITWSLHGLSLITISPENNLHHLLCNHYLILGENGTGKSSFIDAIEFYFTGKVSHLEGAQGVSTARHAPHILVGEGETSVTIEFTKNNLIVTRALDGEIEIPDELKSLHAQGSSATFILRRKNLLDFILAQPAPRYEQLAAIIGIDELDKTERSLMQTRDEIENDVNDLSAAVEAEKAKLTDLIGEIDFTDKNILAALNKKLQDIQTAIKIFLKCK